MKKTVHQKTFFWKRAFLGAMMFTIMETAQAAQVTVETALTATVTETHTVFPNLQYTVTIDDSGDSGAIFTGTLTLTGTQGNTPAPGVYYSQSNDVIVMSADQFQQHDLTFAISGLTETTATGATITFDGFTEFNIANGAADGSKLYSLDGAGGTALNAATGWHSLGLASNPTVSAHSSVTPNFRLPDVRSQFTVTAPTAPVTVNVTGVDNGDPLNGASDLGTIALTEPVLAAASGQDLVYTISGLDIDGVGGTNDSVAITFTATTDGGSFSVNPSGYLSTGASTMTAAGDYVQLAYSSMSVNLNGVTGVGYGSFEGFTSVNVGSWNASEDQALINGVSYAYDTHPSKDFPITGNSMKVENVSGSMRPNNWGFQVSLTATAPTLPTISSFTAIDLGPTIQLTWATTDEDTLAIDQGVGAVTGGTTTVADTGALTYTLTATNADGSVSSKVNVRAPAATGKPNVIFVLVDDWGWTDHSSNTAAQGNESPYFQTPNFDTLANSGVSLTSTYAQPNCAPTRAALLTGQYSCRTGNGVYNVTSLNRSGAENTAYTNAADQGGEHINGDAATITIGEAFLNSGYVTAHLGKYHAGSTDPNDPTHPLNQGYDFNYGGQNNGQPGSFFAEDTTPRTFHPNVGPELDPFAADYTLDYINEKLVPFANGNDPTTLVGTKKHITDAMADAFESFMDNHRSGAMSDFPVYVQFHYFAVHSPIQPRPDLLTKYQGIDPPAGSKHTNRSYAAFVEGMDHTLGRIVAYLDDPDGDGNTSDSIRDNTLIVFMSDNGGWSTVTTDNYPLRDFKGAHYEGGIRVPCVVSMPGTIPAAKASDTLVHCTDFYPTMLDFAGGAVGVNYPNATTHPLDGISLYDHLQDPDNTSQSRDSIFFHFPGYLDTRAYACSAVIKKVGDKRFKFIYSYDPYYAPSAQNDQYQLYNLTDDISETVNLLDYIDLENSGDPGDPSTAEEYWNYLLHKEVSDELVSDLRNWLIGDPGDTTWQPIYVTYKDTYPGIDPELVGENVPIPAATIPDLLVPADQLFGILDVVEDAGTNDVTLEFKSEVGFTYNIQTSINLKDWSYLSTGITGQSGSKTITISNPAIATAERRFYRVSLAR